MPLVRAVWMHGEREQLDPFVEFARTLPRAELDAEAPAVCQLELVEVVDDQQPASIHRVKQYASHSRVSSRSLQSFDDRLLAIN